MRIAYINQPWDTSSPPHTGGSLAIWSYQVARRLARRPDCDVALYEKPLPGATPQQTIDGVTYRRVSTGRANKVVRGALERFGKLRPPQRAHFAHSLYYSDYANQVARDLRRNGCDVVHIHNFSQFVLPIRAHNPSATIVLHMNCDWLDQIDADILAPRLAECDVLMGCTEHVSGATRRRFPQYADRCRTVFNGVDTDWFVPRSSDAPARDDGVLRVLFCGRVSPEKAIHDLFDAFDTVVREKPGVRLEILGGVGAAPREFMVDISKDPKVRALERFYHNGADYGAELKSRMTPDVASRTTFTSFLPQKEVAVRVREADLLVLPSLTESFGMPLAEAMASEVPVVASRVGGMPELVEDGVTGFLVESANPPALASTLLKALALDPAARREMGRRGRERAVRLFSWDRVADAAHACYREVQVQRERIPAGGAPVSGLSAGVP